MLQFNHVDRVLFAAMLMTTLGACEPETKFTSPAPATPELPFFGDGYRFAGDPCVRLGESDLTRNWLDDAADLVGCPVGVDAERLIETLNARQVDTVGNTVLLSVPRR